MTRIQELHKNLSEAEYELQEAERTIRDMQDKIGKLRVAVDNYHCGTATFSAVQDATEELEK